MRTSKQAKKKQDWTESTFLVLMMTKRKAAFEDNIVRMKAIIEQLFSSGAVYYYIVIQGGTSFQV